MLLDIKKLGLIDYHEAYTLQYRYVENRLNGNIPDTLLLLEHPSVLTMGRQANRDNILLDDQFLIANNIEVVDIERGGDVTYHGPGQLVGYMILDLFAVNGDLEKLVWNIEETFIRLLREEYNIDALRIKNNRGIWLCGNKICAIGLAVRKGITLHGFAFNVDPDLSHFNWIVPCGIQDRGVTSLAAHLNRKIQVEELIPGIVKHFAEVFGYQKINWI
jgi:lipoyl(octanoyl) transferase